MSRGCKSKNILDDCIGDEYHYDDNDYDDDDYDHDQDSLRL